MPSLSSIILEMDATTIASRVSRPRPDVESVVQINEQSLLSAYSSVSRAVLGSSADAG